MKNFKKLYSAEGFTIIELLISSIIVIVTIMVFIQALLQQRQYQNYRSAKFAAELVKINTATILMDENAWSKTLFATENLGVLGCVKSLINPCSSGANFSIKDGAENIYFDAGSAQSGYDLSAKPCSFIINTASKLCPFSLSLSWSKINSVMIQVNVKLIFNSKVSAILKPWEFNIIKRIN